MPPPKLNKEIRSFIAIDLSSAIKTSLGKLQEILKSYSLPIRWVKPDGIHITLKFLGNINLGLAERIRLRLDELFSERGAPFAISFSDAGVFPNVVKPRVVWLGIERGSEQLVQIQHEVDTELYRSFKIKKEKRKYRPHLTIGRIKKPCSIEPLLARIKEEQALFRDQMPVNALKLFESILRPSGAEYRVIQTFHFREGHEGVSHEE
ncbi:RNA 2',3'-cyclic phosphodiesterase [candidate division CSSED10-310 bacterium]|uniref:RNA 2',3'-cyclic phosphodiesterase n=1 Tax=candidate division CSSED10-310 bacterium TaxID=2855610 RepID=A0ABV6YTC0_UNCC1